MKEIVTVQVGSFANFIGAHFWNFQDEILGLAADSSSDLIYRDVHKYINMDVLYRSGETHQGVRTYTPRLLSIDCQGSLGCISSSGELYSGSAVQHSEITTWSGNVALHASEPRKRNYFLQRLHEELLEGGDVDRHLHHEREESVVEYLDDDIVDDLEETVEVWTDFSKVQYHPRSLYEIRGLWMNPQEFDHYGGGTNLYSEELRGEEMEERLRFFVEECDHIQGFQFIVGNSGGFSTIAADLLENISDQYSNVPVFLYNVMNPALHTGFRNQQQIISKSIQDAIVFTKMASYSNLIMPVGLPSLSRSKASTFLHIDDEKPYHCSAVYAAALHSICVPFKMEQLGPTACSAYSSGAVDVTSLVQLLTEQGRKNKLAIVDLALPSPPVTGEQAELPLLDFLQPLTPEIAEAEDIQSVESIAVHGALTPGGRKASVAEVIGSVNYSYGKATTKPLFSHLSVSCCPLPIPLPFPRIFGDRVGELGLHDQCTSTKGSLDVRSIPVATRLRSSSAIWPFLDSRMRNLRRLGIDRGAPGAELLRCWGFGKDDIGEVEEMLCAMITALDERSDHSSDSD